MKESGSKEKYTVGYSGELELLELIRVCMSIYKYLASFERNNKYKLKKIDTR